MSQITFTKTTSFGKDVWVGEISAVSGTINIDLERKGAGLLCVQQKASSATRYKDGKIVEKSYSHADLNFNFVNSADNASIDVKLISDSEVEAGIYS